MDFENREYSGAALSSFILALGHSQGIVDQILAGSGVDRIDPAGWYDFDWAISIFYKIEAEVGSGVVFEVGRKMIEAATYPPEIDGVQTLLAALGYWFALNARAPASARSPACSRTSTARRSTGRHQAPARCDAAFWRAPVLVTASSP
ncbi:MAG: hypothetical protein HC927_08505 [Deltaproteobacteria bacterium]|nr:hypothetical protein [Deltaproteobacteria bacterium]